MTAAILLCVMTLGSLLTAEVAAALAGFAQGLTTREPTLPVPASPGPVPSKRRRPWLAAGVCVFALLLGLAIVPFFRPDRSEPQPSGDDGAIPEKVKVLSLEVKHYASVAGGFDQPRGELPRDPHRGLEVDSQGAPDLLLAEAVEAARRRQAGVCREEPDAARESRYRFAERIAPQHLVPKPDMLGVRKPRRIDRSGFQGEQFIVYRRSAARSARPGRRSGNDWRRRCGRRGWGCA